MPQDDPDRLEGLERAERRRRVLWIVTGAAVVVVVSAYLFVPRTLASGEAGDVAWSLQAAPVSLTADPVRVVGVDPDAADVVPADRGRGLDRTQVWHVGDEYRGETIIVGPTPSGADSVRVTIDGPAQGRIRSYEVRLERVGWRSYHVGSLRGHVEVTEIVAIDAAGVPLEVWERGGSTTPATTDPGS